MQLFLWTSVACNWFAAPTPPPPEPRPAPLAVTTVRGALQPLPDPDRTVIIEAVRSLDWCVYCVAQVRAWQEAKPRVDALDLRLVVLSADSRDTLSRMVEKRGFADLVVASATPEVFARLGIPADPAQPELPQGTTLVLEPDGTEVVRIGDANFRQRADPTATLAAIATGRELTPDLAAMPSPDWDGAATLALVREGEALALEAVIAPGFHLYGANEATSIPLSLKLEDGTTAPVPAGVRTERDGVVTWLLQGAVRVTVAVAEDAPIAGEVTWQLCNDRVCSAPRYESFALGPNQGRIIRPVVE